MNSLSPARKAYLLSVRRQKRQVRLWQIALLAGLLLLWELSCRLGHFAHRHHSEYVSGLPLHG